MKIKIYLKSLFLFAMGREIESRYLMLNGKELKKK